MSSTPTLERRPELLAEEWVDIAPRRNAPVRLHAASVVVALSAIRDAISGSEQGIVIDTDTFRPVDVQDIEAAIHADQRWSE